MSSKLKPDTDREETRRDETEIDGWERTPGTMLGGDNTTNGVSQYLAESCVHPLMSRGTSAGQQSSEVTKTNNTTAGGIKGSNSSSRDSTPREGEMVDSGISGDTASDETGQTDSISGEEPLAVPDEDCKAREVDPAGNGESAFLLYSALLFMVCVNCFFNSAQCGFVFDDHKAVVGNMDLRPSTSMLDLFKNDFWGTPLFSDRSHKSYRPLTILTFRWDFSLWGLEPGGYHLVNMLLHWALCVLILRVFKMFFSEWYSFILALLFAVHPIHTDAVASIVGRAEILSAILALSALWSYSKAADYRKATDWNYIAVSIALVVMATLSKEQGITIVAVCCAYEVLWLQKVNLWKGLDLLKLIASTPQKTPRWFVWSLYRMLALISAAAVLVALRIMIMGAQLPYFVRYDNPIAFSPYPTKQLSLAYLFPLNIWLLLNPYKLLCDYSGSTVPLVKSITDPRNLATLNCIGGVGALTYMALTGNSRLCRQMSMALAFLVFPFLPASNIFFCVGFVIAERILYTPSLGFCMLVVIGIQQLLKQKRFTYFVYFFLAVTIALHGGRTARRNLDWKTRESVFQSGLRVTRHNSKLWLNYGHYFEARKEYPEALACYNASFGSEFAVENGALTEIGRLYYTMGEDAKAEKYLTLSQKEMGPSKPGDRFQQKYVQTFHYLALIKMKNESQLTEAENLLIKAIRLNYQFEDAHLDLSELYMRRQEYAKAAGILKKYMTVDPRSCKTLNALARLHHKLEQFDEAQRYFEECLRYTPNNEEAQLTVAKIIEEATDDFGGVETKLALIERYQKMAEESKANKEAYYMKIGALYRKMEEYEEAIAYYSRVLELLPTDKRAISALGTAYREMNNSRMAFTYYSRASELYPDDPAVWQRLGQVLVEGLKKLPDGMKAFQMCLKADPDNLDCKHNSCVVLVKAKQYQEGEACLRKLHEEYPDAEAIKGNLENVQRAIAKIVEKERRMREHEDIAILEL